MPMLRRLLGLAKRLHIATYVAMFVVAVPLVLIMVPGDSPRDSSRASQWQWDRELQQLDQAAIGLFPRVGTVHEYIRDAVKVTEHGWPQPWLGQAVVFSLDVTGQPPREQHWLRFRRSGHPSIRVSWSNSDNWPFAANLWSINARGLFVDLAIALAIIGMVGASSEFRLRRRGGLLRFRISDLLLAITVCAAGLAWCGYHVRLQSYEAKYIQPESEVRGAIYYCGPRWLEKLVGDGQLLPWLFHTKDVAIRDSEQLPAWSALPEFPYLESVAIEGKFMAASIESLKRCRSLQSLRIEDFDSPAPGYGAATGQRLFSVNDLHLLTALPIEQLEIVGHAVLAEDIAAVARSETLYELTLANPAATLAEIQMIREQHPNLEITVKWYSSGVNYRYSSEPPDGHAETVANMKRERAAAR